MQYAVIASDPYFPELNCGIGIYAADTDAATTGAFECLNTATLMDGIYDPIPERQADLGPTVGGYLFSWYDYDAKTIRCFAMPAINAEHAIAQIETLKESGRLIASTEPA